MISIELNEHSAEDFKQIQELQKMKLSDETIQAAYNNTLNARKESDVTDNEKWIEEISGMVFDVNPAEIASHIENGTLKEWCLNWQKSMNMLIITAPLDYSKEREDNA